MARRGDRRSRRISNLCFEALESRQLLASVGWDGQGQNQAELSYYLGDTPAQMDASTFESVIEDALQVWSDVADIRFTETATPNQTDSLDFTFATLDGSGGVLARAYFPDDVNQPVIAGDVQFDSSETWEVGNENGAQAFDMLYIAVHEIGHALGLGHSSDPLSVLSGSVSANQKFVDLADSDRDAILALYAPAMPAKAPTETSVNPGLVPADQDKIEEPTEQRPSEDEQKNEDPANDSDSKGEDPMEQEPTDSWTRRWNRVLHFLVKNRDWFGGNNERIANFSPSDQSGRIGFRWFTPYQR